MRRRFMIVTALVAALVIPTVASAHEGHAHKIMGTVSMHHENHLEIKATDGKISTITLNDKTKIVRGKAKVMADEIQTGERVVVTANETKGKDGKTTMIATEIRLAEATESK
jgi:hypothetical protein